MTAGSIHEISSSLEYELETAKRNVGPFLHKMHAVQWPEVHRTHIYAGDADDNEEILSGWIESPGAVMLDPILMHSRKASAVRGNFLALARTVSGLSRCPQKRFMKLRGFLVRHSLEADRDLWQSHDGRRLAVSEILPPRKVVDAMFTNWHDHNASRCRSLETYIGRSLIRGAAARV